jgi:SAM-dependent methyltransferase
MHDPEHASTHAGIQGSLACVLDAAWFREPAGPDESEETKPLDLSDLRALLACPVCHGELDWEQERIRCRECGADYGLREGIPLLRPPHSEGDAHKEQQEGFFDAADPEFEITRPHGTPWFYRWALAEKFRRSLASLDLPPGATALTVCGGSGLDAEFLARAGFRVVASDLSFEAARRAQERATRHNLPILAIVADAEALPLRDRGVALVYVHDGLHHLETAEPGLREMLRVSGTAVSVNEPARARATLVASRVHLAEHVEEAGNFIARIDPEQLAERIGAAGFEIVRNERYALVYRHVPGSYARFLSRPVLRQLTRGAHGAFNAVAGRIGNKLTLQAVRRD